MIDLSILELTLLFSSIIFLTMILFMFISTTKQRKAIIIAIKNSQESLKDQLAHDETSLKNALGSFLSPQIESKVAEIVALERQCYASLVKLYIDYHPAAIEMTPQTLKPIIAAYNQCIEHIVTTMPVPVEPVKTEAVVVDTVVISDEPKIEPSAREITTEEALSENFQYEALIEQLRFEKQDFATKYKESISLLVAIYNKYQATLALGAGETLESKNLKDAANAFNIEWPLTTQ